MFPLTRFSAVKRLEAAVRLNFHGNTSTANSPLLIRWLKVALSGQRATINEHASPVRHIVTLLYWLLCMALFDYGQQSRVKIYQQPEWARFGGRLV
jgi:hypothetical protein